METKISARLGGIKVEPFDTITVENDGEIDGKCYFGGQYGVPLNQIFIDQWLKLGHNCTLEAWTYFGRFENNDGEPEGLKTAMANKEIDIALIPVPIWEHGGKYEHIYYTHPLSEEYLGMICSYNYTAVMESADLMDAYLDFPSSYYFSLLGTLVVFILAWNICSYVACKMSPVVKTEVSNAKMPAYWIMICAILDQDQYPKISKVAFTILSFCFSLFFFITIDSFMLNTMSSDLVSIKEPKVTRTYQDVLDRPASKLKVLFSPGMGEENFFRQAEPGSKEAQIWDRHMELTQITMETMGELWNPVIAQELIFIARIWFLRTGGNFGLTKTRQSGNEAIRSLVTRDETGKSFMNAIMYSKESNPVLETFLVQQVYRLSQSAILEWIVTERIPRTFGDSSEIYLDTLMSTKLFLPDPPLPEIKFDNIHKFILLYFSLMAICAMVLLLEIWKGKIEREIIQSSEEGHRLAVGMKSEKIEEFQRLKRIVQLRKSVRR